jgi:hypothetical protein
MSTDAGSSARADVASAETERRAAATAAVRFALVKAIGDTSILPVRIVVGVVHVNWTRRRSSPPGTKVAALSSTPCDVRS